jgi:hypothetical protein
MWHCREFCGRSYARGNPRMGTCKSVATSLLPTVPLVTGAIVPVNIGRAHPHVSDDETALTAVKFTQALSENLLVYVGKINTIDTVQQPFMPGRGLDAGFLNAAFVWNPILGRTMNYATLGAGVAILEHAYPIPASPSMKPMMTPLRVALISSLTTGRFFIPRSACRRTLLACPDTRASGQRIAPDATRSSMSNL